MNRKNKNLIALAIAFVASLACIGADLLSQWSMNSPSLFGTLSTANFSHVPQEIADKLIQLQARGRGAAPLLASHYIALSCFPLGMLGISVLFPTGRPGEVFGRFLGYAAFISGMSYHMSMSFLSAAMVRLPQSLWPQVIQSFTPFMLPIGWLFAILFFIVSAYFTFMRRPGAEKPAEPSDGGAHSIGWLVTPGSIMVVLMIVSTVLPKALAAGLRITSFNTSLALCYGYHLIVTHTQNSR